MLGVGYYLSASEWDTSLGMGYPLRLKRVAILIPAQTTWWTRVEESQVEHGVEVRGREKMESGEGCNFKTPSWFKVLLRLKRTEKMKKSSEILQI